MSDEIKKNNKKAVDNSAPLKEWSLDDVDRLLSRTEKPSNFTPVGKDEPVVENFARTMHLASPVSPDKTSVSSTSNDINSKPDVKAAKAVADAALALDKNKTAIGSSPSPSKNKNSNHKNDVLISSKTAKQRVADILAGIKSEKDKAKKADHIKVQKNGILTPEKESSMETDKNRRLFLDSVKVPMPQRPESIEGEVLEKPGVVLKKNISDKTQDLEGMPTILAAEDVKQQDSAKTKSFGNDEEQPKAGLANEIKQKAIEGQIMLSGFEEPEAPEQIDEFDAENELIRKRNEKIKKFKLFGIAEAEHSVADTQEQEKMDELFSEETEKTSKKKKVEKQNDKSSEVEIEYTRKKFAARVTRYIEALKNKSRKKIIALIFMFIAAIAVGILSPKLFSAYGDTILMMSSTLLLIISSIISLPSIHKGFSQLKKKQFTVLSGISIATTLVLLQDICLTVFNAIPSLNTKLVTSSELQSSAAIFSLILCEIGKYLIHSRTFESMKMCSGKNRDKLYRIMEIETEKDEFEIARGLLIEDPDVRYSCKIGFPEKLISLCESSCSSNKMTALLMPFITAFAVINAVVTGIVSRDPSLAVSSFTATLCVCIPAYGVAAIQLPLRWANKRLNKSGALIACQSAAEDLTKANAVVIDSADIFLQDKCHMHGFKDFKTVRVDDALLYAAALVIKSGGPLTKIFDEVVVSRRDLLPTVKAFNYEERLGLSGWIYGQKVILGNRKMMESHDIEIPKTLDESKYTHSGRKLLYFAIANQPAVMIVVSYAPDQRLKYYFKRLASKGVTVLLKNCDSNVNEDMLMQYFGEGAKNIRIISSTAGRIYKNIKASEKPSADADIINDGKAFSLLRCVSLSHSLCGTFAAENLVQLLGAILGFLFILATNAMVSIDMLPALNSGFIPLFQFLWVIISFLVARIRGLK